MNTYSQNKEDLIIQEYFGDEILTLLSIGENNGKDLSNSLSLIEKGWSACLIEPSPQVFTSLLNLHQFRSNVYCYQLAIGDKDDKVILYDSGELLGTGDRALVSSIKKEETKRWESLNMPFKEEEIEMLSFSSFLKESPYKQFYFISLDAEGFDLCILRQMDLKQLGTRCIIVEWNGKDLNEYDRYISQFGLHLIHKNQENLIYVL